jgi:hypothetical protein
VALNEDTLEARRLFMPVAVMEHHQAFHPELDTYDICERLGRLWREIRSEKKNYGLDADEIWAFHARVASALSGEPGEFADRPGWRAFVDELCAAGTVEVQGGQAYNWIFAQLYWCHLTRFRLATVWLFVNALRLQHGHPLHHLSLEKLGSFLDSLSGAGPPISDGQTFYAEDYS